MAKNAKNDGSIDDNIRVTRSRAERLLALLVRGKDVVINSHDEPEMLRALYSSHMAGELLADLGSKFDPFGRVAWLREVDELLLELGLEE